MLHLKRCSLAGLILLLALWLALPAREAGARPAAQSPDPGSQAAPAAPTGQSDAMMAGPYLFNSSAGGLGPNAINWAPPDDHNMRVFRLVLRDSQDTVDLTSSYPVTSEPQGRGLNLELLHLDAPSAWLELTVR